MVGLGNYLPDMNLNTSENIDRDNRFRLKEAVGQDGRFFKEYVLSWRGSVLREIMSGEHLLGADGEYFCYWQNHMNEMTDGEITTGILDGTYLLRLYTKRGEAIFNFIKRFKRIPTEDELNGIQEFMETMEALE